MNTSNPYASPDADVNPSSISGSYQPKFFSFSGRIGRLRYLAYSSALLIVIYGSMGLLFGLSALFGASDRVSDLLASGFVIIAIAALVLAIGFGIRRLNDTNKPGWWVIISFMPYLNIILILYLIFAAGSRGQNNYGMEPGENTLGVKLLAFTIAVIMLIGIVAATVIPALSK